MNAALLIDALTRETARLVATVATTGDSAASVGHLPDLLYTTLAEELVRLSDRSARVIADQFNTRARTLKGALARRRRVAAFRQQTLQHTVVRFIAERVGQSKTVSLVEIERRFAREDGRVLRAIIEDLMRSGVLRRVGSGVGRRYAIAQLPRNIGDPLPGDAHLVHVASYLHPGAGGVALARALGMGESQPRLERLGAALDALRQSGRLAAGSIVDDPSPVNAEVPGAADRPGPDHEPAYHATGFVLDAREPDALFAAIYDHVQAVMTTLRHRLTDGAPPHGRGSTYHLELWTGHPEAARVDALLQAAREMLGELLARVDAVDGAGRGVKRRVVVYLGQAGALSEGAAELTDETLLTASGPGIGSATGTSRG